MPCGIHVAHRLELLRRVLPPGQLPALAGGPGSDFASLARACRGGWGWEWGDADDYRRIVTRRDERDFFVAMVALSLLNYAVLYAIFHCPGYVISGQLASHFGRLAGVVRRALWPAWQLLAAALAAARRNLGAASVDRRAARADPDAAARDRADHERWWWWQWYPI